MSDDVAAFGTYALSPGMERLRRFGLGLGRGALARRTCSIIRRILCLGNGGPFDVEPFPGQRARLYPGDNLSEKRVFAATQFWDWTERAALGRALHNAVEPVYFVDAGANAGLYTLAVRAQANGKDLRVLAIEPDPENLRRLRFNLAASGGQDVIVTPVALSDQDGAIRMAAATGNRGEITAGGAVGTAVPMRPLLDVVREAGFPRIDALKIDIEGMEPAVLRHFLTHADRALWPGMVILEARRGEQTEALTLLLDQGYETQERTQMNVVLTISAASAPQETDKTHVET